MIPMADGTGAERAERSSWPVENPIEAAIKRLQAEFPGWKFWASRDQRLIVATRLDEAVGVDRTLVEDDIPSMRRQLARQLDEVGRRATPLIAGPAF
jgi:hypothetical protein